MFRNLVLIALISIAPAQASLSDRAKALVGAVETRLQIPVNLDAGSFLHDESPAQFERRLFELQTEDAKTRIQDLVTNCRTSPLKEIHIARRTYVSAGVLSIQQDSNSVLKEIQGLSGECERSFVSLDFLAHRLGDNRKISIDPVDIFTGRIRSTDMRRWEEEYDRLKLVSAINNFEVSCNNQVIEIRLATFNSFQTLDGVLSLDERKGVGSARVLLNEAADSCASSTDTLIQFNQGYALRRGLVFTVEPDDFISKRITGAQVTRWIKRFSMSPQLLDKVREKILAQSGVRKELEKLKECDQVKRDDSDLGCHTAVEVRLGNDEVVQRRGFTDMLLSVTESVAGMYFATAGEDEQSLGGYHFDKVLQGAVTVDVTTNPHIPNF